MTKKLIIFLLLVARLHGETVFNNLAPTSPTSSVYPTHLSLYERGGLNTGLTNISQLTDLTGAGLPTQRRDTNMLVSIQPTGELYQWAGGSVWNRKSLIPGVNLPVSMLNSGLNANSGTYWRGDGTWAPLAESSGTVTSVGLTFPSDLITFTGSPITTSGTIAGSKVAQTINKVYASPASGGSANPVFRLLDPLDIPSLDASKIGSGVLATARHGSGTANSTTFLRGDSVWATIPGGGTVTSVGASVPSFLSVGGSPVTGAGTLAISLSGTALPVTSGGSGAVSLTSGRILLGNGTSPVQASAVSIDPSGNIDGVNTLTATNFLIGSLIVTNALTVGSILVGGASISGGSGSPEGVVTALAGSLWLRTDVGAGLRLYVKESSGTGNTGWVAK